MKIIAKAERDRYIVEASDWELANVMGYTYPSSIPSGHKIEVGKEIAVTKLFEALSVERKRQEEIKSLAAQLRKTADRVDSINAALDCPIVEPQQ